MGIAPTRACGEDEAPSALVLAGYRAAAVSGDLQGGWGLGHCLHGEVHGLQLGGALGQEWNRHPLAAVVLLQFVHLLTY